VPTWLLVLAISGPVLALGLWSVYQPRLRTVHVLLGLAAGAGLAAAAVPELAPLAAQAALPGALLTIVAAALRFLLNRSPASPAVPPQDAVVSASSLTQVAPQTSLIIAAASASSRDRAAAERATP